MDSSFYNIEGKDEIVVDSVVDTVTAVAASELLVSSVPLLRNPQR